MVLFLGIEPLPILSQPTANGIPTPSNSSFGSDGAAGRLNRRLPGDTFDVLTRRDREQVSAMMADTAGELGYALAPQPTLRPKLWRMLIHAEWIADRVRAQWIRTFRD